MANSESGHIRRMLLAAGIAIFLWLLSGCGGAGQPSSPSSGGGATISVSISPGSTNISASGSQTFSATVSGSSNTAVIWSTSAGSISGSGNNVTYTAPPAAGSYTVSATSVVDNTKSATATVTVSAGSGSATDCSGMAVGQEASLNGFRPFPDTNPWNQDISSAAMDPSSASIISYIGGSVGLHADFGSGAFAGASIGIPYVVVDSTQPKVNVAVDIYASESDVTSIPIPASAPIEGFPNPGDNHVLVLDKSSCWLYELYQGAFSNGQWSASGSAVWDLQNYNNRPYTWTSGDAAGLPIFPGLVRYDEVAAGSIKHAIRFTVPRTKPAFVSPATHWAGTNSTSPIPMGMRLRLKSSFDVSTFSAANQVILNAMKKYGLILADNGSAIFISGTPDSRWDNNDLHQLGIVTASNFEVLQMPTPINSSNVPTGAAPTISSLSASATAVSPGTAVTLTWQASGASYYLVNPQPGPVRGTSAVVNPTATTTYTLSATNAYGRSTASITIQVR